MKPILSIFLSIFLIGCTVNAEMTKSDESFQKELDDETFQKNLNDYTYQKKINDDTYQTVEYENSSHENPSWIFKTWKIDQPTSTLTVIDEIVYTDDTEYGYEIGGYWYDLWTSGEANYHPYHNLTLTKQTLTEAKKGTLVGVEHRIGTDIVKIKNDRPKPMEEGYYEGGPYVFYPEDTYFYNEDSQKVYALAYKGDRLNITLAEVEAILGPPTSKGVNEMYDESYFFYDVGEFNLYIYEDNLTKKVSEVMLTSLVLY